MGRCYDFGVSIDASSERAMVVAPQGGLCICPSSGASCPGRFAGCAAILNQPGRVPPNAPSWAVEATSEPTTSGANTTAGHQTSAVSGIAYPAYSAPPAYAQPVMQASHHTEQAQPVHATARPPMAQAGPVLQTTPTQAVAPEFTEGASDWQQALGNAEERRRRQDNDRALADLRETVEGLRQAIEDKNSVSVDDLADAVLHLRETTLKTAPLDEEVREVRRTQESIRRSTTQLDVVPGKLEGVETSLSALASSMDTIQHDVARGAGLADQLTRMQVSIERLAKAVVEVRDGRDDSSATIAHGTMLDSIESATSMMMAMRNETVELAEKQARETHALRRQVADLLRRNDERRGPDTGSNDSVELLERQFDTLRREISQIRPNPDVATASQLAQTLNVLREAGVEDISAAHLVHSFQLEMRDLRSEIAALKSQFVGGIEPELRV